MHGAGGAQHLLALEPVGGARVLLDGERVAPQPDDELSRLGRERRRRGQGRDEEAARSTPHVCFLAKGITARVVSQSILITPPLPCGTTVIVNCSSGCGSDSVRTSTRAKSESAA